MFHPELSDRSWFEHWEAKESKEMRQRCNEKARQILADHQVISKSNAVLNRIDDILDRQICLPT